VLSKLAFRAQTVESADLPLCQDLLAKERFNDRSKGKSLSQTHLFDFLHFRI
jgi:hypothetical protein